MPIDPSRLVVVLEPVSGETILRRLRLPAKIGRKQSAKEPAKEDNGIFDSKVLSRSHAEIYVQDTKVMIKDIGSSNGTYVNGDKIEEPAELHAGSEITLGVDVMDDNSGEILHHRVVMKVNFEIDNGDQKGSRSSDQFPDVIVSDVRKGKVPSEKEKEKESKAAPAPSSPMEQVLATLKNELHQQKNLDQSLRVLNDRVSDANILLSFLSQSENSNTPATARAMDNVVVQRKIRQLEQQLKSTQSELQAIQENYKSLEVENKQLSEQKKKLQETTVEAAAYEELKSKHAVLEARLKRSTHVASTLNENSTTLSQEKEELETQLEKLKKELESLKEQNDKLLSDKSQIDKFGMIAQKYTYRSKSAEGGGGGEDSNSTIGPDREKAPNSPLRHRDSKKRNKMDSNSMEPPSPRSGNSGSLNLILNNDEKLKSENTELSNKVKELEAKLQQLTSQNSNSELEELKGKLSVLETRLQRTSQMNSKLQTQKEELEKEKENWETEKAKALEGLKQENEKLLTELKELGTQSGSAAPSSTTTTSTEVLEKRLQRMTQMNEKLSASKEQLEKEKEQLQKELEELKNSGSASSAPSSESDNARNQRTAQMLEKISAAKEQLEKEKEELAKDLKTAKEKLDKAEKKLKKLDKLQQEQLLFEESIRTALASIQGAFLSKQKHVVDDHEHGKEEEGEEEDDEDDDDDEVLEDEEILRMKREEKDLQEVAAALLQRGQEIKK